MAAVTATIRYTRSYQPVFFTVNYTQLRIRRTTSILCTRTRYIRRITNTTSCKQWWIRYLRPQTLTDNTGIMVKESYCLGVAILVLRPRRGVKMDGWTIWANVATHNQIATLFGDLTKVKLTLLSLKRRLCEDIYVKKPQTSQVPLRPILEVLWDRTWFELVPWTLGIEKVNAEMCMM